MMSASMQYKGEDVEQAIANACDSLGVVREALDIEIKSTGSAGIFGLGRRKAVIRVTLRSTPDPAPGDPPPSADLNPERDLEAEQSPPIVSSTGTPSAVAGGSVEKNGGRGGGPDLSAPPMLSESELERARELVSRLLTLSMGEAAVELVQGPEDGKLWVELGASDSERLIGPEGQTLDALQYLLRKLISKELNRRVLLELDCAGFRVHRRENLENRACELAVEVKGDGRSRALPAMGPAERRIVHMALQNDPEIRSRSVGEGVFKKVLLHTPGKGKRRRRRYNVL